MMKLPDAWIHVAKWSVCGASDSSPNAWRAWRNSLDRAAPGLFPPEVVVQIKALACELPSQHQVPMARWSVPDQLGPQVVEGLADGSWINRTALTRSKRKKRIGRRQRPQLEFPLAAILLKPDTHFRSERHQSALGELGFQDTQYTSFPVDVLQAEPGRFAHA